MDAVANAPGGPKVQQTTKSETVTVLVVDDERDVTELYTTWLATSHEVRSAYGGDEALETVDDSVDVVFLDRQMPGTSGDDVLDAIDERGIDCRIVMVTAVDPDFDIVEMPFDDYLTKPVTREDLLGMVTEMQRRDSYDDHLQQYFAEVSKKATLEAEKNTAELDANEQYTEVSQRVEKLREEADSAVTDLDDFRAAFEGLSE